jgi:hypothetical protein
MTVCNSENRPYVLDSLSVYVLRSKVATNRRIRVVKYDCEEYLERYVERYSERNYVYLSI